MSDQKQKTEKLFVLITRKDTDKSPFENVLRERINTFDRKQNHFLGINQTFKSAIAEIADTDMGFVDNTFNEDRFQNEHKIPLTSVDEQLKFMADSVANYINNALSIEKTNTSGQVTADLEVNGVVIGQFSSAELLSLRNYIREFKKVYSKIPTYDPNGDWQSALTEEGYFQSGKVKTVKGRQVKDWKIVAPANQYQKEPVVKDFTKELLVGTFETINYSTMFSPKQKSDLLQRTQSLLVAIDVAIKKANDVPAVMVTEGQKILEFLHTGILI